MSITQYGVDLGFNYYDTDADAVTQGSDLWLADGLENLYQAIQNRLLTPAGTLPLHPSYGSRLHTLIGRGNNPLIEQTVKMMVVEALQPEDRIALIRNIDVEFTRTTGTIRVIVDVLSLYSEALTVPVTYGE